jgi:hypothetical protein
MTVVQRPLIINHNNIMYYNASELKEYDPIFFHGTSGGVRKIIQRKKIDVCNIHYATISKKSGWKSCCHQNNPSTKAKLLLLESWVITNVPKMKESNESKEEKYEYPEVPELLTLEDNEKFKDDDGNSVDIETRGARTSKGIYFLTTDVSKVFEMPRLSDVINNKDRRYKENIHYNFYSVPPIIDGNQRVKQLFITYRGMLKILFSSRIGNAEKFVDWATETLFTIQLGTEDQKEELGSKLIGQSVKNVRAVFKTCSKKVPCIYRFSLGTVKTLRKSMSLPDTIPDDFNIIKFGLTSDLDRRSLEHVTEYEKIPGVKLGLMDFSYIDPKFLSHAETDIKDFFKTIEIPINYEKYNELIAVNPNHEKQIKKQYEFIATAYQGSITELIIEIEKLKNQIVMKDKDLELSNKSSEMYKCLLEQVRIEVQLKDKIITLLEKN